MEALDEPYTTISTRRVIRKRATCLIVLFLSEMLTGTAMGHYEEEISKAVVPTAFPSLIISLGGNSDTQSTTLIFRAIAVGELTLRDWWHVLQMELGAGLWLGLIPGNIGFCRILLW